MSNILGGAYLKSEDDRPNKPQYQAWVSINDIFGANRFQANLMRNEVKKQRQSTVKTDRPTFVWRKAKHLFTFSILCTLILPELGFPRRSPEMISKSLIKYLPSAKSVNKSLICNK